MKESLDIEIIKKLNSPPRRLYRNIYSQQKLIHYFLDFKLIIPRTTKIKAGIPAYIKMSLIGCKFGLKSQPHFPLIHALGQISGLERLYQPTIKSQIIAITNNITPNFFIYYLVRTYLKNLLSLYEI